ncbi:MULTISPECIES: hypothetical protein [unclassified Mesorhizobium]|uniref:hypothetical protein n=1 Tax=unclassified Mesorhizobium TaxID=325217 RepID=UPI001FE21BF0|nr:MULTISPECIES: hypothetical protein [unclassified Mesorhizobium]
MTKYQVEEIYGDTIVVSGIVVESDPLKAAETLAGQPLLPRAAQEHWFRAVDEEKTTVHEYSLVGPDQRPDLLAWSESADFGPSMRGKVHEAELANEQDHFYNCPACGQRVDQRDFRQVYWHEKSGHEPLQTQSATILSFPRPK